MKLARQIEELIKHRGCVEHTTILKELNYIEEDVSRQFEVNIAIRELMSKGRIGMEGDVYWHTETVFH